MASLRNAPCAWAAVLLLLTGWAHAADAARDPAVYKSDLEAFIREVDQTYPFFDLKGIRPEWSATTDRLLQQVTECKTDQQFFTLTLDAIRCLRDAHMQIDTRSQLPKPPSEYFPGLAFMPATQQRVIVMFPGKDIDPFLKVGTIVVKIDGRDARAFLDDQAKAAWAKGGPFSSPQRAALFEYRIPLHGEKKGEKHRIVIEVGQGAQRLIELTSNTDALGWPHVYNPPRNLKPEGRSLAHAKLTSGVGYMYLRRVDPTIPPAMRAAIAAHPDVRGWIVDLCGNGGGGYDDTLIAALKSLPQPVACIIDEGCISAGETLARDLAQYSKARIFGTKSAGSSARKEPWKFPSGIASVILPRRGFTGLGGKIIEYNGISPDEVVEPVPEEAQRGQNSAILRAEKYILGK